MLPLKDDIRSRSLSLATVGLIAVNALVFLYQVSLQMSPDPGTAHAANEFVFEMGMIPCRLTGACRAATDFPHPALTIFTSMFLHGTLFHIGGNMLYLWIFGNNVEDTLGHIRFIAFYLASGVVAALAQTVVNPASQVPMIGASGAVSGVLGAYLLLFPFARVLTLIMFGFVYIPAVIVLGFWIVVQLVNGFLAVGHAVAMGGETGAGVAWFAHIGGFLAGMVLLFVLRPRPRGRL